MKIKVVTVGDGDVGKTQLVITLVHQIDHFCEQYIPTIFDTTSSLTTLAQQESYTEPIQRTSFREFQHTFEPKVMNHQRKKISIACTTIAEEGKALRHRPAQWSPKLFISLIDIFFFLIKIKYHGNAFILYGVHAHRIHHPERS